MAHLACYPVRSIQIIDIDQEPAETRRLRRRMYLRFAFSAAGILLILGGLVGTAILTRELNERDVLAFSGEFMKVLDDRITSEVQAYLSPASDSVHYMAAAMPRQPLSENGRAQFERMAEDILARHPQIAILYLGTTAGEFLLVMRNEAGSVDSKAIYMGNGQRDVAWYRRDAKGDISAIENAEDDTYDPRTREWFSGALASTSVYWSDVYIFYTDQVPGITAARTVDRTATGSEIVVGADIYLEDLGNFLSELRSKARGDLAIVDSEGRFVAFSEPVRIFTTETNGPQLTTIHNIGEPALSEAFDRVRIFGEGQRLIEIDGTAYLVAAASLRGIVGHNWQLLMLAPASEYTGFIAVNSRRGLLTTAIIIAFAFVLAGVHSYQVYAAERNVRTMHRFETELTQQTGAFETLSSLPGLSDPDDAEALRRAVEILTMATHARRASIWQLSSRGAKLICLESSGAEEQPLTSGSVLQGDDLAALFENLKSGRTIGAESGADDRHKTGSDKESIETPGVGAVVSLPVLTGDELVGAVRLEYEDSMAADRADLTLARTFANLVAPRLKANARGSEQPKAAQGTGDVSTAAAPTLEFCETALSDSRATNFEKNLGGLASTETITIPTATVMALRISDDSVMAATLPGQESPAMISRVVDLLERATERAGIPYLKILTDVIIAVDGFRKGDDQAAAGRILELALAMQEECSRLFVELGREPLYSLGIDTGPVIGTHVGLGGSPYNIWGEAVRVATAMAETAQPGSIQLSQSTFELQRHRYVFRRRGMYYLERQGEISTYTLGGRG